MRYPQQYLYAIQRGGRGPIKIGISVSPLDRVAALQTAHHAKLRLLGYKMAKRGEEALVHSALDQHRIIGEWFKPCPAVMAFVRTCDSPQINGDAVMRRMVKYTIPLPPDIVDQLQRASDAYGTTPRSLGRQILTEALTGTPEKP